jgi:RimJ/RimL family protein N-acetyltransferase
MQQYLPEFDEVDLGYRFLPQYWGQGLATEACAASIDFAFQVLGLARVIGLVLAENVASIRVLEKVGMHFEGEVSVDELTALRFVVSPAAKDPGSSG